jgi:phosphatidylglycerophosphate synthase
LLDLLDGATARLLSCETRFGACFDAQSDRLVLSLFLLAAWQLWPQSRLAIISYFVYIILIDGTMFTQAMQAGVLSTNYYYVIDRTAWRLCWSPVAKFVTSVLVPTLILLNNPRLITLAVIAVAAAARVPIMKRVLVDFYKEQAT